VEYIFGAQAYTMNKQFFAVLISSIFISLVFTSCFKHLYFKNDRELRRYARAAKEPGVKAFIVMENGDSVSGNAVKRRRNLLNGKAKYIIDGKKFNKALVTRYQDKYGYHVGQCDRLLRALVPGKMSVYLCVTGTYETTRVSRVNGTSQTVIDRHNTYACSMDFGGALIPINLNNLRETVKDCPAATAQVEKEFKKTGWAKKPESYINDYRAILRIAKVYNNNCK
jgi:hypothetical protein